MQGKEDDVYRRYHFFLFDYGNDKSINTKDYQKFKERFEKDRNLLTGEKWTEEWEKYPNYDTYKKEDLADGPALDFVAWLVHTFAPSVCGTTKVEKYATKLESQGIAFITLDDFAYMFVQAQNNMPGWTLQHRFITEGKLPARIVKEKFYDDDQKKLMEKIKDVAYRFQNGTGVSGGDGQKRYSAMLKFFYDAYFDKNGGEVVEANKEALLKALKELLQQEKNKRAIGGSSNTDNQEDSGRKKKKARILDSADPKLAEIHNLMWDSDAGFAGGLFPV